MQMSGRVSSGLGRAHVFMAQTHYQTQFKNLLGSTVWPGTLNVQVEGSSLDEYRRLRVSSGLEEGEKSELESHRVKGFESDGVSFGGATAFLAKISTENNEFDCAILIPDLTRHQDVVEVIADKFLRESMTLLDGDEVHLHPR